MTERAGSGSSREGDRGGGERFPREARLTGGREIRRVLREGRRHRTGVVDVYAAASPADRPRVGVVVPLFGRTAVERNRLQRRLREIGRRCWLPRARSEGRAVDVLVRARPDAYDAEFDDLRRAIAEAVGEL